MLSCDPLQYEYTFDNDFFMAIYDIFIRFLYIHFYLLWFMLCAQSPIKPKTNYRHRLWNYLFFRKLFLVNISFFTRIPCEIEFFLQIPPEKKIWALILLYPGWKFTNLNYHFGSVSSLLIPSPTQKFPSKSEELHVNKIYIELSIFHMEWSVRA